jgi:hypothetical protein
MYGLTFREKYRRITRKIPINMEKNLFIIDESIFLDFIDENVQLILFRVKPYVIQMK